MIVRWTFGQTPARPLSPQGIDMLETSVKFAMHVFEGLTQSLEFIVCHNNLNADNRRNVNAMAKEFGITSMDVTGSLPSYLWNKRDKRWEALGKKTLPAQRFPGFLPYWQRE